MTPPPQARDPGRFGRRTPHMSAEGGASPPAPHRLPPGQRQRGPAALTCWPHGSRVDTEARRVPRPHRRQSRMTTIPGARPAATPGALRKRRSGAAPHLGRLHRRDAERSRRGPDASRLACPRSKGTLEFVGIDAESAGTAAAGRTARRAGLKYRGRLLQAPVRRDPVRLPARMRRGCAGQVPSVRMPISAGSPGAAVRRRCSRKRW